MRKIRLRRAERSIAILFPLLSLGVCNGKNGTKGGQRSITLISERVSNPISSQEGAQHRGTAHTPGGTALFKSVRQHYATFSKINWREIQMNFSLFICYLTVHLILLNFVTGDDQFERTKRNTDVDVLGLVNIHTPSRKSVNVDVGGDEWDRNDKLVNVNVQGGHHRNVNVDVGRKYEDDGKEKQHKTVADVKVQREDKSWEHREKDVNVDVRVPKVRVDVENSEERYPKKKKKRVHLRVLDKWRRYGSDESDERRRHLVKIERERDDGARRKTVYIERERNWRN